ncbi:hypothetical protein J1785_03790, partial [Rahnella sp. SL6]|uniref:hypothetical protein n=1 Tax=Rahnella perminowiae TaxID=2816244 RepID=UPI001C278C64
YKRQIQKHIAKLFFRAISISCQCCVLRSEDKFGSYKIAFHSLSVQEALICQHIEETNRPSFWAVFWCLFSAFTAIYSLV